MVVNPFYHQCLQCIGKPARIRTVDGHIHHGIVERVNHTHVFLRPMRNRNLGRFGYGGWGGWGLGFASGIALAAIAAFSPLFFW